MSTGPVLAVRVGAMGDVLHALAAVQALRAARPEMTIGWVVEPRWAPLLVNSAGLGPVVSHVHLAETKMWSEAPSSAATMRSVLALRRAVREVQYEAVVDLQGTMRSAVIGSFAGTRRFAGFADPRERAAKLLYKQRVSRMGAHIVEQETALLGAALGLSLQPARDVPLPVDAKAEVWAEECVTRLGQGRPVAVLAPTAGWGAKQWPAKRFGALAAALHERGWAVVVNAASRDDLVGQAVVLRSGQTAQLVCCKLPELLALMRRVRVMVGGDSGPVHLAAALGVPTVALFGPTDPARNGPWGAGPMRVLRHAGSVTSYKRVPEVDAGLAQIGVDEVLEAVQALVP